VRHAIESWTPPDRQSLPEPINAAVVAVAAKQSEEDSQ
jgi:hypothetical protein